jgi:hypothetical protein
MISLAFFSVLRWQVFGLRDLFVPTTDLDIITNELRNAIESIVISIFGYLSVNSSHGGLFVENVPSRHICDIVRSEHVSPTFAAPPSTPLTPLINAHFQTIENLYKEAGAPEVSRAYFEMIIRAASTSQTNGFVPMVMVEKDTTSRSLRLGIPFVDPRCGPASALYDAMQSTLNTPLPDGNVTPSIPFVDMYDFSTSFMPSIANLHLCKYLSMVRPLVVHSMSSLITNVFHDSNWWTDSTPKIKISTRSGRFTLEACRSGFVMPALIPIIGQWRRRNYR